MKLDSVVKWLKENEGVPEVAEYLDGLAISTSKDGVFDYLTTTPEGEEMQRDLLAKRVQKDVDRKLTKAIETHDKKRAAELPNDTAAPLMLRIQRIESLADAKDQELTQEKDKFQLYKETVEAGIPWRLVENSWKTLDEGRTLLTELSEVITTKVQAATEQRLGDAAKPTNGQTYREQMTFTELQGMTHRQRKKIIDRMSDREIEAIQE